MTPAHPITEALDATVAMLDGFQVAIDVDDVTVGELARHLEAVDRLIASAQAFASDCQRLLEPHLGTKATLIEGVTLVKSTSYGRKGWQHDDLRAAARRHLVTNGALDMATGEIVPEHERVARRTLDLVDSMFNLNGYAARLEGLRAAGIDPNDFSESSKSTTVRVVR